jgi:hypothetical protein
MVGSLAFCISVGGVFDVETKGHLESIVPNKPPFFYCALIQLSDPVTLTDRSEMKR